MRSQKQNKDTWVGWSMIYMLLAMKFNFLLFMAILQRDILGYTFYEINLSSLSDKENNLITILILFALPIVILNYLLIFRNKRCKKLVKKYKYPDYNGKLAFTYIAISLLLPAVLIIIGIIATQDVTFLDFFRR
jgi:hypothetical protein